MKEELREYIYGFCEKYWNFCVDDKYFPYIIYSIGKKIILVLPEHHKFDLCGNYYNDFIKDVSKHFNKIILLIEGLEFNGGRSRLRGLEDLIKEGKLEVVDILKDINSGDISGIYLKLYEAWKKYMDVDVLIVMKFGGAHLPDVYRAIRFLRERYIIDKLT